MKLVTCDPAREKLPEVLTTKCLDVEFPLSHESQTILLELEQTLGELVSEYGNTRGIGLSANQINHNVCISIINFSGEVVVLVNPKVIKESEETILSRVGCLSFFKYRGMVRHPEHIEVAFKNTKGEEVLRKFSGDEALIVLHEIDHLKGISLVERSESGIFVPWEIAYPPGSRVPFKNWGVMFSIRKYLYDLGLYKAFNPQTDIQYYGSLFREKGVDFRGYIEKSIKRREELLRLVKKYTKARGKILEAGCGTSAHSVYLSTVGYDVSALDIEEDMLMLAKRVNAAMSGSVHYLSGDIFHLPFKENMFDCIFSHGVLEHFSPKEIIHAVDESLRVAETVIISVPTIFDVSNNLMGDEILRSPFAWKAILQKTNGDLKEMCASFPFHSRIGKLNALTRGALKYVAPVSIFVLSRKQLNKF